MPAATQFCVGLENKPGRLAGLCTALRAAGVNIQAVFVSDDNECCWVNFLVDQIQAAEDALTKGKYHYFTEKVLEVRAADGPAELEAIATKLAQAEININYVYGSTTRNAPFTLVLHVSDLDRAAALLSA